MSTQSRNRPGNADSASTILAALDDEPPYGGAMNDGRPQLPYAPGPDEDSYGEDDPQLSDRSPSPPPIRRRRPADAGVTCESVFSFHYCSADGSDPST